MCGSAAAAPCATSALAVAVLCIAAAALEIFFAWMNLRPTYPNPNPNPNPNTTVKRPLALATAFAISKNNCESLDLKLPCQRLIAVAGAAMARVRYGEDGEPRRSENKRCSKRCPVRVDLLAVQPSPPPKRSPEVQSQRFQEAGRALL